MFRVIFEPKDTAPFYIITPTGQLLCKCHYQEYAELVMAALKQCVTVEIPKVNTNKKN